MSPIREGVYRYVLQEDFVFESKQLDGIFFANRWIVIQGGQVRISKDYAWDGCSPSYYVPFLGWIGTPDGPRDEYGYPQSYYASLVHDALCQFRWQIDITRQKSINIFRELLIRGGFSEFMANLYARVVKVLGPNDWLGDRSAK